MATQMNKRRSRQFIMLGVAGMLALLLIWAFWPRPLAVDLGEVRSGSLFVTIDEEARTRVRDAYVVSAPIAGRLLRVEVEPGDDVFRRRECYCAHGANTAFCDGRANA